MPVLPAVGAGANLLDKPDERDLLSGPGDSGTRPLRLRAAMAWRPVLLCAGTVFTVLVAVSPGYGYYRDELYFRILADHPAWGYIDQPPLTPMLAKAGIWLFGDTVTAVRIPAALCTAVTVVLAAMIAAELGGKRRAQLTTVLATGTGLYPLLVGHTLLTSSADMVAWVAIWLLAAKALLRHDGRWWLAVGAVFGLALYNKYLVLVLAAALLAGILACGPRSVLRNRWLWAGIGLALLLGLPNIVYQATHGWPQLTMAHALAQEGGARNRLVTIPGQLVLIGLPLVPVWVGGAVALFRRAQWRPVRALGATHLAVVALVLATAGRMDYAAATLVPLLAAGCVRVEGWMATRSGRRWMGGGIAVNAVLSALLVLPVMPVSWLAHTPLPMLNPEVRDGVGWSKLVDKVAEVRSGLPATVRSDDVLLAHDYGEAGALDRYGDRYDLPDVYSGHNELSRWLPPSSARDVVAVGIEPSTLDGYFEGCHVAGRARVGVRAGDDEHDVPITVCRNRQVPWQTMWPDLTHFG